ncbi:MAG: TatD family hydrolase [Planctomycetaceae bacterium]|jgi:TatD DNase family protein|nr:TatD family hydrolase [Planctomycetaceae bacterium]
MKSEKVITVFDTHAHLDSEEFNEDRELLISRLLCEHEVAGRRVFVSGVLIPGTDLLSSYSCVEISLCSSNFYAAVGIHPNSDMGAIDSDWLKIEKLAERDEVVAIGETGLDRYRNITPMEQQVEVFCRHIDLSIRLCKPILIHCRDAWEDILPILRKSRGLTGVIHSFNGTSEQAREMIDRGFYISFAGQVTYLNEKFAELHEVVKTIPEDRLLIETDSPYLLPHPFRGKLKRNEPSYVIKVAERLSELRGESLEQISQSTTKNAQNLVKKL